MTNRREFLKQSALAGGLLITPIWLKAGISHSHYTLPALPYSYDALEPFIDAQTMQIHHGKHHQAYVNNLNKALEQVDHNLAHQSLEDLLRNLDKLPENVRTAIRNNGGGHWNHSHFWQIMSAKPTKPSNSFDEYLTNNFGGFLKFQEAFTAKAMGQFGSGWAWLVDTGGKGEIIATPNQDNPLMMPAYANSKILLGLDVWEHAYYLKYQNKRGDYIGQWFNVVNWPEVERIWQKG